MSPGLTRSGEGDGRSTATASHWIAGSGKAFHPVDPESEDLLALAAIAARSSGPRARVLDQKDLQVPIVGRERADRCPGVTRPWPAKDGLLVRLRLVGGRVSASSLDHLLAVAEEYGDGRVQLTSRANLQVRALPDHEGRLPAHVRAAVESTGLLPSAEHDLVRNVMVSPQTGLSGGRADLRPVASVLDTALLDEPRLADLPGRFLFVLDDGRGDLLDRTCDLGLVALDDTTAQLRVGDGWGAVVPLRQAVDDLVRLALVFLESRGEPPRAAWHLRELARPLLPAARPDPRLPVASGPLGYGPVPGGTHIAVPDGLLDRQLAATLTAHTLIVTPWRGVLVPEEAR